MREIAEEKRNERREKMRKIRRKRRLTVTIFVGALILVAWSAFLFYNSSFFNLKEFSVSGNKHLPKEKVIELSGVGTNTNLLKISLSRVEESILKDPWVEKVEIKRNLPNELEIKITERNVIAAVAVDDQTHILVDKEGMMLESRQNVDDLNLPVVRDIKLTQIKIGELANSRSLRNALACLDHLDAELQDQINLVSAPSTERLSLYTREGVEILYGKAEDMTKKNYVLKKILFEQGGKVIFIDVRVASNPAVRRLKQ